MIKKITLNMLEKELAFFNKMYDAVRVVDPVRKQVLQSRGCTIIDTDEICYKYWKSQKICDNCISVRAYQGNKSYMKLEQSFDSIMLVIALPIENTTSPVVLELLKNATDSMMIGSGDYNDGQTMHNIISELNDMAMKDSLTSLYNHRYIKERLPVDIIKSSLEGCQISIILFDIDNLKQINDKFGHLVGDQVLQQVGQVLRSCIRGECDWSARYGGDEFLICLNNTDNNEAYKVSEQVREQIEKICISTGTRDACLSASFGVQTMKDTKLTSDDMIRLADYKMYNAKNKGKNCIVNNIDKENEVPL
ncbi:MAG: GGDEF domain-containing protein [Parabacteroides sp.]|nr:GGDEF domain-containing protein [Eubacteriales bacterium]MDD4593394.1 GGDEF domain-containing protein [Parabacteroides sp.]